LNPIVLSIPVFFVLIGLELAWSWWKKKPTYRLGDAFANIGCGVVEQLTALFAKVFTIALYSYIFQEFRLFTMPTSWPWLIVLFIGVDFCYYWAHRMSHEVNLFWIGHVVHHQSEDYNLSVALRQGALQKLFTAPFFLPLALLGFNDEWFLILSAFNTLYQFWIHTEWIKKMPRWFEYIFNTPSHHRVHHGRNPQYIDKNHGGSLIIWDRMFGTFAAEEEEVKYGVTQPIQTWNPIRAHWLPIQQLYTQWKTGKGHRWSIFFRSPSWLSKNLPDNFKAPAPNKLAFGFHTSYSRPLAIYLISHFTLIIGQAAFFLFLANQWTVFLQLAIVGSVLIQFFLMSFLLEAKRNAHLSEGIRLVIALLTIVFLLELKLTVALGIMAVFLASWLVAINQHAHIETRTS
jgi:sterol desaturase/sphingolipid hydroxylase (fatty acid hydroxylase superfamily)